MQESTAQGEVSFTVDVTALPRPGGTHAVQPGETWYFQCWFRDRNPNRTSDLTGRAEGHLLVTAVPTGV